MRFGILFIFFMLLFSCSFYIFLTPPTLLRRTFTSVLLYMLERDTFCSGGIYIYTLVQNNCRRVHSLHLEGWGWRKPSYAPGHLESPVVGTLGKKYNNNNAKGKSQREKERIGTKKKKSGLELYDVVRRIYCSQNGNKVW